MTAQAINASFLDWSQDGGRPAEPELAVKCQLALMERMQRQNVLPELYIDPLTPLPLADAAGGVVHFVYFIMASRPFGWETINRNVIVLQRPGALQDVGTNDSNVFLVHVDAKLGEARKHELSDVLIKPRPDVYIIRRPRPVLWAGWSMILALFDAMASVLRRSLHFEYFINLSDADLSLRTDTELRSFFARFEGRSIMSIVQRKKDPRRYKMHEGFRSFCWTECQNGSGFFVSGGPKHPMGFQPHSLEVIGKNKCCWSRTAPIIYSNASLGCANTNLPEAFHGSQWVSLHRPLVHHMIDHPFANKVMRALEHTLLPDEVMLQTIAVNSPFRKTLIPVHLRFIEWPQSHGDANKYWASVGPQFHGGPMVLNASLAREKAFRQSGMFARKVDPGLYRDVLDEWDMWMDYKMLTNKLPNGQPEIAAAYLATDPELDRTIPPPTPHEDGWPDQPLILPPRNVGTAPLPRWHGAVTSPSPPANAAFTHAAEGLMSRHMRPRAHNTSVTVAAHRYNDDHNQHVHGHTNGEQEHEDGGDGEELESHKHPSISSYASGFLLLWVVCVSLAGVLMLCQVCMQDAIQQRAWEWLGHGFFRTRKQTLHPAKMV